MNYDLLKSSMGHLRIVGFIEGMSFLFLLGIAMPMKYMAGQPELVRITGMIHGVLFLLYVAYVIVVKFGYKWSIGKTSMALLASLVPFGTFYADVKLFREE